MKVAELLLKYKVIKITEQQKNIYRDLNVGNMWQPRTIYRTILMGFIWWDI
jgi:hypothetical protein